MHRAWRRLFALLALASLAGASTGQSTRNAAADTAKGTVACTHCRARLGTVEALRSALPVDWRVAVENEPVFDSTMLVVQAGRENPQTLLLVHGLGDDAFTDWLPVMQRLAQTYHVLALDLPGFGYSARPVGKYSPTNYARVLHALLARHAKGPAIVAGHSMGGAVSLRLAEQFPADLVKLVLVDAAGILHRTAFVKHTAELPVATDTTHDVFRPWVERLKKIGRAAVEMVFDVPGDPVTLLRQSDAAWGRLLVDRSNVNAALALMDEDFSAAVHGLALPVQVIWGDDDRVAPLRTGELLASRLPRAELHIIGGADHTPMASAPGRFGPLFERVLAEPPRVAPHLGEPPAPPTADLACRGEADRRYSGHWREVRIENCQGVRLEALSAERIVLRDSIVQMQDVSVRGDDVALDVSDSELTVTASDFAGRTAIRSDDARLDLAGVSITGIERAIEVRKRSRLILSVSRLRSPAGSGYVHDSQVLERTVWPKPAPAVPAETPRN